MSVTVAHLIAVGMAFWGHFGTPARNCPIGVFYSVDPQPFALGHSDTAAGWADMRSCSFTIRLSAWRTMSPPLRCAFVIHEMGHSVMGFRHASNPRDVMYPKLGPIPKVCKKATKARWAVNGGHKA